MVQTVIRPRQQQLPAGPPSGGDRFPSSLDRCVLTVAKRANQLDDAIVVEAVEPTLRRGGRRGQRTSLILRCLCIALSMLWCDRAALIGGGRVPMTSSTSPAC